jgi:hypothetical protein
MSFSGDNYPKYFNGRFRSAYHCTQGGGLAYKCTDRNWEEVRGSSYIEQAIVAVTHLIRLNSSRKHA